MTNKLRTLLAFSALTIAGTALPAFAGDTDPMHVNVPFAFRAGRTTLPAGEYVVVEEDSGIILIRGSGGNAMLLSTAGPDDTTGKAGISFERSEKGFVLKSIHGWERISSSILPITAGDK